MSDAKTGSLFSNVLTYLSILGGRERQIKLSNSVGIVPRECLPTAAVGIDLTLRVRSIPTAAVGKNSLGYPSRYSLL